MVQHKYLKPPVIGVFVDLFAPPPSLLHLTESAEEARLFGQNALFAARQNARNSIGFCKQRGINGGESDGRQSSREKTDEVGRAGEQKVSAEVTDDDAAEDNVRQLASGRLISGGRDEMGGNLVEINKIEKRKG